MPNEPKTQFLIGKDEIQARFRLKESAYNTLVHLGMPITKINGRIYGYFSNIETWLQQNTMGGEIEDVPEDGKNGGEK